MAKSNSKELKFSVGREERSLVLCANFLNGYTTDFKFTLPESFRDALDIKRTERVFGGDTNSVFTQGSNYAFKDGDVIYNTKEAYELDWNQALKSLGICLQIIKASDAYYEISETYEILNSPILIKYSKLGSTGEKEEREKLVVNKYKYYAGSVEFQLLKPNTLKTKLIEIERYETTQEDFVVLLQNGVLRTLDKKEIKIL